MKKVFVMLLQMLKVTETSDWLLQSKIPGLCTEHPREAELSIRDSKSIGELLLNVESFISFKDIDNKPIHGELVSIIFRSESKNMLINLSKVDLTASDCTVKSKIHKDINLTITEMLAELESYLSVSTAEEMSLYDESGTNEVTFNSLTDFLAIYMSSYDDLEILETLDSESLDKIVMRSLNIGETCNFSGDEKIIERYPNETYLICMLYNLVKLRLMCDERTSEDINYGLTYVLSKEHCSPIIRSDNPLKMKFIMEYEYGNPQVKDLNNSSEDRPHTGLYIQMFSGTC